MSLACCEALDRDLRKPRRRLKVGTVSVSICHSDLHTASRGYTREAGPEVRVTTSWGRKGIAHGLRSAENVRMIIQHTFVEYRLCAKHEECNDEHNQN